MDQGSDAASGNNKRLLSIVLRHPIWVGLLATASAGCIPLPFVVPPTEVNVGVGQAMGTVVPSSRVANTDPSLASNSETIVRTRVGTRPLALPRSLSKRRFGFVAGYIFETMPREELSSFTKHGGYVGPTFYPWSSLRFGSGWRARVGISTLGEVLYEIGDGDVGGGATTTANIELFRHSRGAFAGFDPTDGSGTIGGAYGEFSVGLELSGSYREIGGARYGTISGGLTLRFPAIAGVLLVPIWNAKKR